MAPPVGTKEPKKQSPPPRDKETSCIEFISALYSDVGAQTLLWALTMGKHCKADSPFSSPHRMVRPRLTIYVCQESLQLREQQQQQPQPQPQQKQEDGDSDGTFFGRLFWAAQDREEERGSNNSWAGVTGV